MLAESIAAGLIADGISSVIGISTSEVYRRVDGEEKSITDEFVNTFSETLCHKVDCWDDSGVVSCKEVECVLGTASDLSQDIPSFEIENFRSLVVDGLSSHLGQDPAREELEKLVDEALEEAISEFITDVAGTELGERLLINSQLETAQSLSEIECQLDDLQSGGLSSATYNKYDYDDFERDCLIKEHIGATIAQTNVGYVQRDEVPEDPGSQWHLVLGRRGLGKSTTLVQLASRIEERADLDHLIIPKQSFCSIDDLESIVEGGIDGDVLFVWDDIQEVGSTDAEESLREILLKFRDYLESEGHELVVVASIQADAASELNAYKDSKAPLWGSFNVIELQELSEEFIRTFSAKLASNHNLELGAPEFNKLVEKVSLSDPSPMYVESVMAQLASSSAESIGISHIEQIQTDTVSIWENLYSDLCERHPDARFILWGMELLQYSGIPPYESTLRKLYIDLFDRERFKFERSLEFLLRTQWITESDCPWTESTETVYRAHDLQIQGINEDSSRIIEEYSQMLLGPLESTIPDDDSNWIPHYHCNTAISFSTGIVDDAEELARSHFNRAVQLDPLNPVVRLNFGEILSSQGEYEKAAKHYETALEVAPDWADLRHSYAFALDVLGQKMKAIEEYRHVLESAPHHAPARVNLGMLLVESGQFQSAKSIFESALSHGQVSPELYNNLGILCQNTGEIRRAERFFRKGLDLNPNSLELRQNLSTLLFQTRQPEAAEEILRPAIRDDQSVSPDLWRQYALFLAELGKEREAREYIRRYESGSGNELSEQERTDLLAQAYPAKEYEDLPDGFGYADFLRDEGHYQEAKEEYLEILNTGHESKEVYLELAEVSRELSNSEAAEQYFEEIIDLVEDDADIYMMYGNFLKKLGNYSRAIDVFQLGLEALDHPRLRNDYALCLMAAGHYDEAELEFRALIRDPRAGHQDFHRVHQNYGNLLVMMGEEESASKHFEHALEQKSDYPEAQVSLGSFLLERDRARACDLLESGSRGLLSKGKIDDGISSYRLAVEAHERAENYEKVAHLCEDILDRFSGISLPEATINRAYFRTKMEAAADSASQ